MEITKGLGIAAIIIAVIGIFIPVVGIWLALAAIAAASVAALRGDRVFATSVSLISLVNFYFLTPSLWLNNDFVRTAPVNLGLFSLSLGAVFILAALVPLLAIALNSKGLLSLGGAHADTVPHPPKA